MKSSDKDLVYAKEYRERNKEILKNKNLAKRQLVPWKYVLKKVKQRCDYSKSISFKHYGAKGIKCLLTENDIEFLWNRDKAWLLSRPSIDRKKSNEHYTLENCRFIEWGLNSSLANIQTKSIKILQYTKDFMFLKEWSSINEAGRQLNIHPGNICKVLKQKQNLAGNYIWRYKI